MRQFSLEVVQVLPRSHISLEGRMLLSQQSFHNLWEILICASSCHSGVCFWTRGELECIKSCCARVYVCLSLAHILRTHSKPEGNNGCLTQISPEKSMNVVH